VDATNVVISNAFSAGNFLPGFNDIVNFSDLPFGHEPFEATKFPEADEVGEFEMIPLSV
jgi:hypothetical protein